MKTHSHLRVPNRFSAQSELYDPALSDKMQNLISDPKPRLSFLREKHTPT